MMQGMYGKEEDKFKGQRKNYNFHRFIAENWLTFSLNKTIMIIIIKIMQINHYALKANRGRIYTIQSLFS